MELIRRFGARIEADLAASFLRAYGVDAVVAADDAGGLHPELAAGIGGCAVHVPADQARRAAALLADVDAGGPDPDVPPTFVLVHGAWHGPQVWEAVARRLEDHGRDVVTVELPSSGVDPGRLGDLDADVTAVRTALDAVTGASVLVGHSYGGVVITQAAAGRGDVAHLVYVAALMLDVGGSLAGPGDRHLPSWVRLTDDGTASRPVAPVEVFYPDLDADVAATAVARLRWQSTASLRGRLTEAAWRWTPATYVVCDRDTAIPAAAQVTMARNAGTVHHLGTAHSPFLADPDGLTAILLGVDTNLERR